jgi:hypothetical protein
MLKQLGHVPQHELGFRHGNFLSGLEGLIVDREISDSNERSAKDIPTQREKVMPAGLNKVVER